MFVWFDQNNSGGYFVIDENFDENVIIESEDIGAACEKLNELGADEHDSCPCCGDRWDLWEGWQTKTYNSIQEAKKDYERINKKWKENAIIHYADGTKEKWTHDDNG